MAELTPAQIRRKCIASGIWDAVDTFRNQVRDSCLKAGLSEEFADATAWEEVERNFLKKEPAKKKPPEKKRNTPAVAEVPAETAVSDDPGPELAVQESRIVKLPASWPELPATAKYDVEVEWVYQNYVLACEQRPTGNVMRLSKCRTAAPSLGAVGLLQWAMDNRTAFFKDLVPKAKRMEGDDELEFVRAERKSIAEIEAILNRAEVAEE